MSELASTEPEILHQGRYRIYRKADAGLHIVYRPDGQNDDIHMEFPGALIRLAEQAGTGKISPMQMMRSVIGIMNSSAGGL